METKPPRQRIADATVELLRETGDRRAITVRRIAERAGVAIGLINYHFSNKDELIDESIRASVGALISKWDARVPPGRRTPRQTVLALLQAAADFLATYPKLSRMSIEYDVRHPRPDDNTAATFAGLVPALRRARPNADEARLRTMACQLVAPLQLALLRGDRFEELVGFNFFDPRQRRDFVEQLVENVLGTRRK